VQKLNIPFLCTNFFQKKGGGALFKELRYFFFQLIYILVFTEGNKAPDAEDFSAINDALTDDSSSSSSDDESDEKKSSKDSTAEAKTDIKKEPSPPPAAAETPKTEISEYFISVYNIFYLVHNLNVARNDLTRN
jgi:CCR4-NOT transcriptional regulation complex NOT5 subunit